ncbi:hypothetical protein ACFYPH_28305 [Micromonospora sp. NPDC005252]|uniref:hypothetical protein n=1 Tax=Micromonospora sp. NPDC005252 TaxID=3364228 RepID=UPI00368EA283
MPEPQPGARPADGRTPGPEPDDAPAVADESTSPPVPPDHPAAPDQPEPTAQEPTAQEPAAQEAAAQPEPTAQEPAAQPEPTAQEPAAQPEPTAQEAAAQPAASADSPAPRWSGSAPVPPPLPRRRAWGESAEPTPPPPLPEQPPEHRTPVDPWAGVDTGGWDLPSAELPPLPPTLDYPAPPSTRQWSGPPAPPVGMHPVSPSPAHPTSPAYPARPTYPAPPAHPAPPARPALPAQPGTGRPTAPVRPAPPARVPKQRRGRRSATPPPVTPPPGWEAPKGYVPVPVRRRRRWPWLLLLTLACCCGCPAYYGLPISSQYPARAALPGQVADLSLREDDVSAATARQLENEVRQENWLAEDTFAGVYATADGKRVTVFGGTGFRLNPEADANAEITRLKERYALESPETVQTGVRGRHERCAIGRPADGDVVVCTSVDHGSIATGVFTRLSVVDSADLLKTLRGQIVQPERG